MKLLSLITCITIVAFSSMPILAQEAEPKEESELAKLEIFGGYAFLRAGGAHGSTNLNGWTVSIERNLNRKIALVADFDGTYRSNQNSHSALFGPKFTARTGRFAPFVHSLAGVVREKEEGHVYYGFGLATGLGVDYDINQRLSLRIAQVDYEYSRFDGMNHHNFRFATGVVLKFGRK